jgi:hypothetical protein
VFHPLRTTFFPFVFWLPDFSVYQEGLPTGHRGCTREAIDPKAPTFVSPGLCQGPGLAHEIGVPAAAERAAAEHDADRG